MRRWMRRKQPSANAWLGMLFLICLFFFSARNLFSEDRVFSETENRYLEQMPILRLSELMDGRFMTSFEKYQTDQFFSRDSWIEFRSVTDRFLGKNESGGVYLGKDGQLYEKPEELRAQVWKNLDALKKFAGNHSDKRIYLLLAPGAAGVKPEGLPPFAPVADQAEQLRQIHAYINGAVQEISVYETLREHREEYLYYRTDHHWTTLGAWYAFVQAEQVMELEETSGMEVYPVTNRFQGTLASRSGYRVSSDTISVFWPEEEERLVVTYVEEQKKSASLYASKKLETRDQYGVFLNGNHPVVKIRTMAEGERTLLILKDSYANCFVPFLTSHFREIVLVDPRYYYGNVDVLMEEQEFTDILFLYNLNTFLEDDVLHFVLEGPEESDQGSVKEISCFKRNFWII